MATITDIAAAEPTFVVERFEPSGDRIEVAGHWLGLRGRRFVRPVLWLHRAEDRRRLVAVLDHKPWTAGEGDPWIAAFAWEGGKLDAERAELEVGRELVVELPLPGARAPREPKPRPARARRPSELERVREQLAGETRERRALEHELAETTREADELARVRAELDRATAERDAARAEAEQARADGERLVNDEYRQRERALQVADEATGRAREAEAARDLAQRQLTAARRSYAELEQRLAAAEAERAGHEQVRAQLQAAREERDAARAEPERLRAELTAAVEERDRLRADLETGRRDPERARLERELAGAWAERDRAEGELAAAREGRERVESELVATRADRKRLERELASPRGELERRPAVRRAPAVERRPLTTPQSGAGLWAVRLVALALVAILLGGVAVLLASVL